MYPGTASHSPMPFCSCAPASRIDSLAAAPVGTSRSPLILHPTHKGYSYVRS